MLFDPKKYKAMEHATKFMEKCTTLCEKSLLNTLCPLVLRKKTTLNNCVPCCRSKIEHRVTEPTKNYRNYRSKQKGVKSKWTRKLVPFMTTTTMLNASKLCLPLPVDNIHC